MVSARSQIQDKCQLTYKVEAGHQALPASLGPCVLQGPPGWHTPSTYPKLLQLRHWTELPFPLLLFPIQSSRFDYSGPFGPLAHCSWFSSLPLSSLLLPPLTWFCSLWLVVFTMDPSRCLFLWLCSPSYLQKPFSSAIPRSSHDLLLYFLFPSRRAPVRRKTYRVRQETDFSSLVLFRHCCWDRVAFGCPGLP